MKKGLQVKSLNMAILMAIGVFLLWLSPSHLKAFELDLDILTKANFSLATSINKLDTRDASLTTASPLSDALVMVLGHFQLNLLSDLSFRPVLNFSFSQQHVVMAFWEVAFINQPQLQIFSGTQQWGLPFRQETFADSMWHNILSLAYSFKPVPVLSITPLVQYFIKSQIDNDVESFDERHFLNYGYTIGFDLHFQQKPQSEFSAAQIFSAAKIFSIVNPPSLGWTTSFSFTFKDVFYSSNNIILSNITPVAETISAPTTTVSNILNHKFFASALHLAFRSQKFALRTAFSYDGTLFPNALFATTSQSELVLASHTSFRSHYEMSFSLHRIFFERLAYAIGSSGTHWYELYGHYRFSYEFIPNGNISLAYPQSADWINGASYIATTQVGTSSLILYSRAEEEATLHELALSSRLNFLPRRSIVVQYVFNIAHFGKGSLRLDQFHTVLFRFLFLDALNVRYVAPYVGFASLSSRANLSGDKYFFVFSMGMDLQYHF